jgi:hypothetical protein
MPAGPIDGEMRDVSSGRSGASGPAIGNHLKIIGGGQTYAQLSAKALTQPKNLALAGQVEAMFKGTMLRGSLLNAYAFWKMGQIALVAAIVAFAGAAILLVMSILGYAHLRRVPPDAEVCPHLTEKTLNTA